MHRDEADDEASDVTCVAPQPAEPSEVEMHKAAPVRHQSVIVAVIIVSCESRPLRECGLTSCSFFWFGLELPASTLLLGLLHCRE